jgi:integrase
MVRTNPHHSRTHVRRRSSRPNCLANLLRSTLSKPLQQLRAADIQKAYNQFERDPSPRTRRYIHRILKSALARAVEQQVLSRNPADALKRLPKVERKPVTVLTAEQSTHFLKAISHATTYWPTLIALATGMRRGEILALRWRNVDLKRGAVRVVESLEQTKAGLRFKSTKTEKARAVTLPPFALNELRRWKREQAEGLMRIGVRQNAETLVCARQDGNPKQPGSLRTNSPTLSDGQAFQGSVFTIFSIAMRPKCCWQGCIQRSYKSALDTRRSR